MKLQRQAGYHLGLLNQYDGRVERKGWKSLDTKIASDYICTIFDCFFVCVRQPAASKYIREFSCSVFRCSFSLLVPVWGWYKQCLLSIKLQWLDNPVLVRRRRATQDLVMTMMVIIMNNCHHHHHHHHHSRWSNHCWSMVTCQMSALVSGTVAGEYGKML